MRALGFLNASDTKPQFFDAEVPNLAATEVLVRVHAVAMGEEGQLWRPVGLVVPFIPGRAGAGTIAAIGSAVTDFTVGDAVVFSNLAAAKGGAWAEFTAVPTDRLVRKPPTLDFVDAATLPISGETAVAAVELMAVGPRRTVLIAGGVGAAGLMAVQIAGRQRSWVLAAAQREHHNFLRSIGALAVFNQDDASWPRRSREFAMPGVVGALAVGQSISQECLQVVRDGGRLVLLGGGHLQPERGIDIHRVDAATGGVQHLQWLAEEVAAKRLRAFVDRVFPWERFAAGLERLAAGNTRGTVVLTLVK